MHFIALPVLGRDKYFFTWININIDNTTIE